MELKLSIPQRPKMVHFMPIMDLLALVFILPLLLSNLSSSGGHMVSLPDTSTSIPSIDHASVVQLLPGDPMQIWLNNEQVTIVDLSETLEQLSSEWIYGGDPVVLLKADKSLTSGQVADVRNLLAEKKFAVWVIENLKK